MVMWSVPEGAGLAGDDQKNRSHPADDGYEGVHKMWIVFAVLSSAFAALTSLSVTRIQILTAVRYGNVFPNSLSRNTMYVNMHL